MKKLLLMILSLVLLLSLCSTVVLASNWSDEFIIGLDSNPSTGYSWEAKFNDKKVQLIDHWYKAPEPTLIPRQGAPGIEYFRFKHLRGWAKITMEYKRSWEDEVVARRVFYIR